MVHRARDHPPAVVARRHRSGDWVRVARGAYVDRRPAHLDRYGVERYLALGAIAAALSAPAAADRVLSHFSAAEMLGLPRVTPDRVVHVTQRWSASKDGSDTVVRHTIPLSDAEICMRGGHRVTSLERTAVDCALLLGPEDGLVVMDAALHMGAQRELCEELLERRRRSRGVRVARAVLAAADDGAESPGETRARLAIVRLGVVVPETQVPVATALGRYWCDLGWPDWGVVGEYDGVWKYSARGTATAEVLREKRREEAIQEVGRQVLRIVNHDVRTPVLLERRLRRVLPPAAFGRRVDPHLR